MTMHPHHEEPHDSFPQDPIRALEEALRIARAATHCKRLDTATQGALDAIVRFGHAAVDAAKALERRVAELERRRSSLPPDL